jgi:tryptophanyl-tRNA synthetase
MSKSRNNAVMLRATADETAALVKKAKTDTERNITCDPAGRPEVANLLLLASLCSGEAPEAIAQRIGDGGSGSLKKVVTDALNEMLAPIRARRTQLAAHAADVIRDTLRPGIATANRIADATLNEVRDAMKMGYGL